MNHRLGLQSPCSVTTSQSWGTGGAVVSVPAPCRPRGPASVFPGLGSLVDDPTRRQLGGSRVRGWPVRWGLLSDLPPGSHPLPCPDAPQAPRLRPACSRGACVGWSPEWGSGPWRDSVHPVPASPAGHHRASLHVAAAPTPSLPHSPPARNFLPSFLQTPPAGLCSVTSERPPSRRHFATLRAWWDWGSGHKEKTLLTSPGPRHVRSSRRAETRQSAPRFQSLLRPAEAGRPSLHRLMSLGARPCPPAPGEVSLLLGECPHGLPVIRLPPGTLALCSRPSLPLWVPSSRSSTGRPPSQPPGPDLRVSPRRCYPGSLSFGPCSCFSPLCLPHHTLLQASCLRVDRTLSGVVVD